MEFLDSVLESTRAKEEAIRKETVEQLDVFRKQQEKADRELLRLENDGAEKVEDAAAIETPEEQWKTNARKRRRAAEKEVLKGVKVRKASASAAEKPVSTSKVEEQPSKNPSKVDTSKAVPSKTLDHEKTEGAVPSIKVSSEIIAQSPTGGGLLSLDYGSDDDGRSCYLKSIFRHMCLSDCSLQTEGRAWN